MVSNSLSQKRIAMVSYRGVIINDRAFLLSLRKVSMNKHLQYAGLYLDDTAHLLRIDECFSDSYIMSYRNKAIGLLKLGLFADKIHLR